VSKYLLDACALIAFLNREEGWSVVKELIEQSERREITLSINLVNLVEVHYDRIREEGPRKADEIINRMYDSSIVVIEDMGRSISNEAAHLKAKGEMSLADAFCVATAVCTGAAIVTARLERT